VPDGAAETGRAVLEETAGRAAARVVCGRARPASAGVRVIAPARDRMVIAIATFISSVTPLDVVVRAELTGTLHTTDRGVKVAKALQEARDHRCGLEPGRTVHLRLAVSR